MPMHGPHAHSRILAPDLTMSASSPVSIRRRRTCLEPGDTVKLTSSLILRSFTMPATVFMSLREELVQLPTHT